MANNKIQVKRTTTAGRTPNTTSAGNTQYIAAGELALNMTDQIMFTSDGTNLIYVGANQVNQRITNALTIDNSKSLRFSTVNTSAAVSLTQQNDDNFVFYSTNTAYGSRAVWGVFANSITSNLQVYIPLQLNAGLVANSSLGSAGQVLTTNGTATYWSTVSGGGGGSGTVTSVGSGDGLTGGPITTTGTISVVANSGIVANATGVYVNTAYIGTLDANNAAYLGGVAAAAYVQNTFTGTLSGDIVFTGNNSFSQVINVGSNVWVSTASFKTGNLTVNAYMNSSLITVQSGASSANITFNAFRTGVSTVNSTLIAVGANVIANTTTISVGNSTVNTSVISGSVTVANSTNTATMTPTSVSVGTTVVNTSQIFTAGDLVVQGLATINVNSLAIGNSTANLNANSILLTVANSTSTANLTPADLKIGATTVVNSTQITATTLVGNVSGSYANITGQVNTATLYAATSANVASVVQANSTGVFVGASVSANTTAVKVGNTTITSILATLGGQLNANGGVGTAGQVLTSGAAGNVYWSTVTGGSGGGSTYMKGGSATVGSLAVEGQNIFRINANLISYDVTFVAGENASATGPLTVAAGKTITIPAGARVSII